MKISGNKSKKLHTVSEIFPPLMTAIPASVGGTHQLTRLTKATISIAVASVMTTAQADVQKKMIGDLEIYSVPESGTATMMMMLDTSGSMSEPSSGASACDISTTYTSKADTETTDAYTRYGCEVYKKTYFYKRVNVGWPKFDYYSCGTDGSTDPDDCTTYEFTSSENMFTINQLKDMDNEELWSSGDNDFRRFFYKDGKIFKPDRLTRVKDAIFGLMDGDAFNGMNSNNLKIGIGQFSSNVDNNGADGSSGRIIVPAKKLDDTQRQAIKDAVAKLEGKGGTPAAHAYAEAGAYMMGTTTKGSKLTLEVEKYIGYRYYYENRYSECTKFQANMCVSYNPSYYSTSIPEDYKEQECNYFTTTCFTKPETKTMEDWGYSGYDKSEDKTKTTDKKTYDSPISNSKECDGNGIYFLTDGEPNNSGYYKASAVMNKSLKTTAAISQNSLNSNTCGGGLQGDPGSGWGCMGQYSKLIKSTDNPKKASIKTATVGFGSKYSKGTGSGVNINCSTLTDTNAKNLCLLGSDAYGGGGFTATSDSKVLAQSIINFITELKGDIKSVPSGIIVVPDDPFNANTRQAVAYYPSIDAKVNNPNVIWPGNMKKYALSEGTLYGKSDSHLFLDIAGALNAATQDLWSDKNYTQVDKDGNTVDANNLVTSGGMYAQLKTPDSGIASTRTLYLEDEKSDGSIGLRKLGVNASGKVILSAFDNFDSMSPISDSHTFSDTATYTENKIRDLVRFLGFKNIDNSTAIKDLTLTSTNVPDDIKVLGASMHSIPALLAYSAGLDVQGRVNDKRDQYVLFGSMDGALHLADADDYGTSEGGQEVFAFIPREIINNQSKALVSGSKHDKVGSPKMGMDAPWLVVPDYDYKFDETAASASGATSGGSVTANSIWAYGGMRMGGDAFYGMDLTDKTKPKMLFTLSPAKSDFNRMGQIWSKPTKAKIKRTASDKGTDVLVFGGGYDTCYENPEFQIGSSDKSSMKDAQGVTCDKTEAQGNAVYIVNAQTGELIWSASKSGSDENNSDMVNSIVGGVTVLDRNNDGFMDHIYFADLGGQVFRADFKNAGMKIPAATASATDITVPTFASQRVVKILNSRYSAGSEAKYNYRFYQRPVVSFYRNPNNNHLFAMINVISGDRSSPLSKMREDLKYSDRVYGIIDSDITQVNQYLYNSGFYTSSSLPINGTVKNITDNDLYSLPKDMDSTNSTGIYSLAEKNKVINGLKAGSKKGWYYPLTRFDGYNNVRYTKGIGKSSVIGGFLYTTTYNPDMKYGKVEECTIEILGGSERQLYCLPYGVCKSDESKNGTGGFVRAGKGLQELTLGPRSSDSLAETLLIGTTELDKRKDNDRIAYNSGMKDSLLYETQTKIEKGKKIKTTGGDGTILENLYRQRYTLTPKTWYEQSE